MIFEPLLAAGVVVASATGAPVALPLVRFLLVSAHSRGWRLLEFMAVGMTRREDPSWFELRPFRLLTVLLDPSNVSC